MPAAQIHKTAFVGKRKKGTKSKNRFKFESFSEKVAALSINPVSRARGHDLQSLGDDLPTSHFVVTFERWRELNVSAHFVSFVREVEPMCETLPQIVHYQDRLVDRLVSAIGNGDTFSLEPLLDLVSSLAHDLGHRFESHFPGVLTVILAAALAHHDPEVIGWSFTALAWLFKYLSRLLVPDLRPTFDAVAPYLGRSQHNPHLARFAAEALSFLLRKASAQHHRDEAALHKIVEHILRDATMHPASDVYKYGLMNLFANAVKGVDHSLHSSGLTIFEVLFTAVSDDCCTEIVTGVFANLIHHCTANTLSPLLSKISDWVSFPEARSVATRKLGAGLLFYAAAARDGARILQWTEVLETASRLCTSGCHLSDVLCRGCILERAYVTLLAKAPLDIAMPHIQRFIQQTTRPIGRKENTLSLLYMHILSEQRFEDLVLPHLEQVLKQATQDAYRENLLLLHILIPNVRKRQLQLTEASSRSCLPISLLNDPDTALGDMDEEHKILLDAYLDLTPNLPLDRSVRSSLAARLEDMIRLQDTESSLCPLLFGKGLRALLQTGYTLPSSGPSGIKSFLTCCTGLLYMPQFLENLLLMCDEKLMSFDMLRTKNLPQTLLTNLSSSSKHLRYSTLRLLRRICPADSSPETQLLEIAFSIEESPADIQNVRKIAMHVRQLSSTFQRVEEGSWLKAMTPLFCFGLLTYHLSEIWGVAIEVLEVVSHSTAGESAITNMIGEWLAGRNEKNVQHANSAFGSSAPSRFVNEFQDFKAEGAKQQFDKTVSLVNDPSPYFYDNYEKHLEALSSSLNLRTQALTALKGLPRYAEKRSRHLVPLFLAWTSKGDETHEVESLPDQVLDRAFNADLQAFLDIFGSSQSPRTLFRSVELYDRLLRLTSHSNPSVQKKALDAILTWKQPGVVELRQMLHNLLDESRFREELLELCQTQIIQDHAADQRKDVMPVLLRLLFGRMTVSLKASGNNNQKTRRRAVLNCFHHLTNYDIEQFITVAVSSVGAAHLEVGFEAAAQRTPLDTNICRRLLGLINLITEMLLVIGDRLSFISHRLMKIVLGSLGLALATPTDQMQPDVGLQSSLLQDIRQQGTQCITSMFEHLSDATSFSDHIPSIFELLIDPRVERLPEENSQSVSSLFQLFAVWVSSPQELSFLMHNPVLPKRVADVLNLAFAKDEVKIFTLDDILSPLLANIRASDSILQTTALQEHFMMCCDALLHYEPSKQLLASTMRLVLQLAPSITGESQVHGLLGILKLLLAKQQTQVSIDSKRDLLDIMREILPHANLKDGSDLFLALFHELGDMYGTMQDNEVRERICSVLEVLTHDDTNLHPVAVLCSDLNSHSPDAIDLPDFDRRRQAINSICAEACSEYSARQWRPLLQNLIYYAKATDDFDISMNARVALCSAISKLGSDHDTLHLIVEVVLPALRSGARVGNEDARRNCLDVMAQTVRCHPSLEQVSDLECLLMDNDEEASIFNNLFHVQQHRRIRALRRLASPELSAYLQSKNVSQFLIPLLEHFVFDRDDDSKAGDLASEAITTIGALSRRTEWSQARAILRRYTTFVSTKPGFEKTTFRLLAVLIDAIVEASRLKESSSNSELSERLEHYPLRATISKRSKLGDDFSAHLLPPLIAYLHDKDESVVSLRTPVAVSIVKAMMVLDEQEVGLRLPPVLTDVCQILRSKSDESRDLVRNTLGEISQVVGARYFGFIIKELQAALTRGYQLHVLSFTTHTLLVEAIPMFTPGDLDYCLADLANIIVEDIFGTVGYEKDADDYSGKSKEIKSRKSFDSMELLASKVSINCLGILVTPVETLLIEKLDLRTVRKADELLRRLASGLLKNEAAESRQSLTFCYELLQRSYRASSKNKHTIRNSGQNRFLVNLKGKKAGNWVTQGSSHGFKILCFAFDVIRALVVKFESLRTPANIAGFLPSIGDAMLQAQDDVQIAAMRLLAAIVRVPLPELDQDGAVYLATAIKIVKDATSLTSELVQAALKLITAYIRERPDVSVKEADLAEILKILRTELDRSESQGLIFNFLKALLVKSTVLPEVYDVMDRVARMMVTHMSRDTRHMARAVYLQFLLHYPQGTKRLEKQISFLRSNLQYEHIEGRQAIMEAIHLLLSRVDHDLQEDIIGTFFNPLVLMLVNDESLECRKMAGLLLASFIKAASSEKADQIHQETTKWLSQHDNPLLHRAGFQVWSAIVESAPEQAATRLVYLRSVIISTIEAQLDRQTDSSWELLYYALQLAEKMTKEFPPFVLDEKSEDLWNVIHRSMSYPHKWTKTISANLIEIQLSDFLVGIKSADAPSWPVTGQYGLSLDEKQSITYVKRMLKSTYSPELSEDLANVLVRNLMILAQISQALSGQVDVIAEMADTQNDADAEKEVEQEIETIPVIGNGGGGGKPVLQLIFHNISVIVRKEPAHNKANALIPKGAALQLCATLCNGLPASALEPFLQDIMQPMYSLIDPNIPTPFSVDQKFTDTWKEQVASAREILDLLQTRIGSAEFLRQSSKIQARVRERREERRSKRKLSAITAPEWTSHRKERKGERQKERRKEKSMEFRERRRGW